MYCSLLSQVSRWIGEGPHMDVLSDLIRLGLDPGAMDLSFFHKWPRFSDPNWLSEGQTPDPFGTDFLRQCLEVDPGTVSLSGHCWSSLIFSRFCRLRFSYHQLAHWF
jgi:hypothetical protein